MVHKIFFTAAMLLTSGYMTGMERPPLFSYDEWKRQSTEYLQEHGYKNVECIIGSQTIEPSNNPLAEVIEFSARARFEDDKGVNYILPFVFRSNAPESLWIKRLDGTEVRQVDNINIREFYKLYADAELCEVDTQEVSNLFQLFDFSISREEARKRAENQSDYRCIKRDEAFNALVTENCLDRVFFEPHQYFEHICCGSMKYPIGTVEAVPDKIARFTLKKHFAWQQYNMEDEGEHVTFDIDFQAQEDENILFKVIYKQKEHNLTTVTDLVFKYLLETVFTAIKGNEHEND